MGTRFSNLMNSVPNDDDLDQVYFWERKAHVDARAERQRLRLKQAKLRLVFECQWDGMVKIRCNSSGGSGGWEGAYLVVQGHRLVWWSREDDVDEVVHPAGNCCCRVMPESRKLRHWRYERSVMTVDWLPCLVETTRELNRRGLFFAKTPVVRRNCRRKWTRRLDGVYCSAKQKIVFCHSYIVNIFDLQTYIFIHFVQTYIL